MAYTNQNQSLQQRATAIAGVVAVHAAIGAGLLIGLRVAGVAPPIDIWDPYQVTVVPTPTPTPPPPTDTPQPRTTPDITAPLPPLDLPRAEPDLGATVTQPMFDDVPTVLDPRPVPTPQPPRPSPSFAAKVARPANAQAGWVTTDDYPAAELRREIEGSVGYRVVIGTNGRVTSCEIVSPSGSSGLDRATCRFITSRARFEAATDTSGARVVGNYSGTVRWEIPD